jgi:hypothetical protein
LNDTSTRIPSLDLFLVGADAESAVVATRLTDHAGSIVHVPATLKRKSFAAAVRFATKCDQVLVVVAFGLLTVQHAFFELLGAAVALASSQLRARSKKQTQQQKQHRLGMFLTTKTISQNDFVVCLVDSSTELFLHI